MLLHPVAQRDARGGGRHVILNIAAYLFVAIDDADALAARIRARADADALRGSVLVTPEGLNLFLAGEEAPLRGFLALVARDSRFACAHREGKLERNRPVLQAEGQAQGRDHRVSSPACLASGGG